MRLGSPAFCFIGKKGRASMGLLSGGRGAGGPKGPPGRSIGQGERGSVFRRGLRLAGGNPGDVDFSRLLPKTRWVRLAKGLRGVSQRFAVMCDGGTACGTKTGRPIREKNVVSFRGAPVQNNAGFGQALIGPGGACASKSDRASAADMFKKPILARPPPPHPPWEEKRGEPKKIRPKKSTTKAGGWKPN